jgi:FkbM family methyltransferase
MAGLIFDFGFHHGLDTDFYLRKGYSVVAVEANPVLCERGRQKFSGQIASGQLVLLNVGVSEQAGHAEFFVNEDNDEWSSFDRALGTRDGTRYTRIEVPTESADAIFERFETPYYVKVDIEGYDALVVSAVARLGHKPSYLSVEDNGIDTLIQVRSAGGRRFQFLDQIEKWKITLPDPPLEGAYVEWTFGALTSGPFGRELPGPWFDINEAARFYVDHVRPGGRLPSNHWWDIHVAF